MVRRWPPGQGNYFRRLKNLLSGGRRDPMARRHQINSPLIFFYGYFRYKANLLKIFIRTREEIVNVQFPDAMFKKLN
jgi:hypothetical protein